MKDHMVFTC